MNTLSIYDIDEVYIDCNRRHGV